MGAFLPEVFIALSEDALLNLTPDNSGPALQRLTWAYSTGADSRKRRPDALAVVAAVPSRTW